MELHAAPPLKYTVEKAKGYDMGVVVLLDSLLSLRRFAKHPSHTRFAHCTADWNLLIAFARLNELYKDVCDAEQTVAYDIQFRKMASQAQKSVWERWVLCFVILALFVDFFMAWSFPFSGFLNREGTGEVSGV